MNSANVLSEAIANAISEYLVADAIALTGLGLASIYLFNTTLVCTNTMMIKYDETRNINLRPFIWLNGLWMTVSGILLFSTGMIISKKLFIISHK